MKARTIFMFAMTALLIAACAPVTSPVPLTTPNATAVQPATSAAAVGAATAPPITAATAVGTTTAATVEATAAVPLVVVAPTLIPGGWQIYANSAGFAISYPSTWTAQAQPDTSGGSIHTEALKGPEGEVDLSWGTGFGGACPSGYSTVKVADGEIQTCYTKRADGTEIWDQMSHQLPSAGFSGRAFTSNAQPASHDMILQILSTLTFAPLPATTPAAVTPAAVTPVAATPAAATPASATPIQPATGTPPTPASAGSLQPLSPADCTALANAMSKTLGVKVTGDQAPISDYTTNGSGIGCQAVATGTGEQFKGPDTVIKALNGMLVSMGWTEDPKLASGGPTGMGEGFRKDAQICLASAIWQPSPEANCPKDQPISACKVTPAQQQYTVALNCAQAVAATPSAGMANPASVNCAKQGGALSIETNGAGGQYGVCTFEDNRQCEEWALMRGECPAGGLKVTGYVTPAARYCAITGGTYQVTGNSNTAKETGTCTLKSGKQCDAGAYYNGAC